MNSFLLRFLRYWSRSAGERLWRSRQSFGVRYFALICLAVLASPFLRSCFQVQNLFTPTMASGLIAPLLGLPWHNDTWPNAFFIERLHALYPHDHDVELAYAEGEDPRFYMTNDDDYNSILGNISLRDSDAIEKYNALMKQWTRDPIPVARWLRHTANILKDVRVAGGLESLPQSTVAPAGMAIPAPTPTPKPSYTPSELNHAIAVARSGQKLEPQNSYFDWMLIYFLLCARRDNEAIRVLDAASRKQFYDDHSCDVVAAFIHARERVRPTLIEEKWTDVIYGQNLFFNGPHIARLFSWIAWQKDQAGDVQGALSIRGDLARMGQLIGNGHCISLFEDFSRPISRIAWRRDLRPSSLSSARRFSATSWRTDADDFADYAMAHHRPDIARETHVFVQNSAARQLLYRSYTSVISSRVLIYIGLGVSCLLSIAFFIALYVALSILLLLSPSVEVERRDVWSLALFLALTALVGIFCLHFAIAHLGTDGYNAFDLSRETSSTLWLLAIGVVLLFITPLLLSALWCALGSWRRARQSPETRTPAPGLKIMRLAQFFVCGSAWSYAIAYSVVAAVMAWQGVTMWSVKVPALGEIYFNEPWWNLLLVWPAVALFSLVSWFCYARFFAAPPRTHTLYALRRFRQTLLALVPIYSAFWISIALLSLPQRHRAEAQLNDLLQHGEVYVAEHPDKYR